MTQGITGNTSFYEDVLAVCLIIAPVVFLGDRVLFLVALHYTLYALGLILAITQFIGDGMNRSVPWLHEWFPRVLFFTFVWDLVIPLKSVPPFSILKLLFYVLIMIQLSHFVFGHGRFFRSLAFPYPLCVLLVFICAIFIQGSFPSEKTIPGLANASFMTIFLTPQIYAFILSLMMIGVILLLALKPSLFRREYSLLVVTMIASLTTISIVLPGLNWSSLLTLQLSANLPLPLQIFCLFLYLVALSIYNDGPKFQKIADYAFPGSFTVLYLVMNSPDIHEAVLAIEQFGETIGTVGSILIGILSIVSAIYTFAEFHRSRTQTNP